MHILLNLGKVPAHLFIFRKSNMPDIFIPCPDALRVFWYVHLHPLLSLLRQFFFTLPDYIITDRHDKKMYILRMVPQCIPAQVCRGITPFKHKKRTLFRVQWKHYFICFIYVLICTACLFCCSYLAYRFAISSTASLISARSSAGSSTSTRCPYCNAQ